jgi:hypothetical protein
VPVPDTVDGEKLKLQFKALARIVTTIEKMVEDAPKMKLPGVLVKSVEMMCERLNISPIGVEFLDSMLRQSPKITLSECRQWCVRKELPIDVN